jgi:hypothetical protein
VKDGPVCHSCRVRPYPVDCRAGGVIAGSSAGAAIMSGTMFAEPKTVLAALKLGVIDGHEITEGLGFIGDEAAARYPADSDSSAAVSVPLAVSDICRADVDTVSCWVT